MSGAPQELQKRAWVLVSSPQDGQVRPSSTPHWGQKRLLAGMSAPQETQRIRAAPNPGLAVLTPANGITGSRDHASSGPK